MKNCIDNNTYIAPYMNFLYYSKEIIKTYPKSEDYGIIKQINYSLYYGLKSLMEFLQESNKNKKSKIFNDFCINIDFIKVLFEISYKSNYISLNDYKKLETLIGNIPIKTGELN